MKNTLTVLLIEDSFDYAALVKGWLSLRTEFSVVLHWAETLQDGLNRLTQGDVDLVLLDLGLPDSSGLETFSRTRLQASGVPVIILSGEDNEKLALQTMQAGAQDYIVKSSCNGDLLAKAIRYAVARTDSRVQQTSSGLAEDQATVIGVMGVKGGVGGTTIACSLAVELRLQTKKKTLLADLDLDSGIVGFLMNVESQYSVLDAASNIDRLDTPFWDGLVAHSAGNVDVLRSPNLPGGAEPDADSLRQVLAVIRKLYRWAVVDLGRPSRFSLGLLDTVTELFLVTTTSIPALYEARRIIDTMRKAGFDGDRLRLIVNQPSKTQEFSGSDITRLFGVQVYGKFSAAVQDLHDACVRKMLPDKNCDFRLQMATLARKVAGLQMEKQKSRAS